MTARKTAARALNGRDLVAGISGVLTYVCLSGGSFCSSPASKVPLLRASLWV